MRLPLMALIGLLAVPAWGQVSDNDEWSFTINFPMVWLPDIRGEVDVDGERIDIDIPISDIIDNLDAGFIGEVYARRGRWGLAWRTMYLATQSESTVPSVGLPGRPPIIGKHRAEVNGSLFTTDFLVDYGVNDWFGVYTGFRRSGSKISVRFRPLEDGLVTLPGRTELADEELWDWVGGIALLHQPAQRWRLALQVDTLISGDNDSNNQVNAFAEYRINERNALWFGYRYLNMVQTSRDDGSEVETDFTQQGPTLGWAFHF